MNKNSKEIRKVPNLRFPGFEGEWIKKPLGKISQMKAGKFVRANDIFEEINDGLYPCYGGNGLRGYTSSFTHYGKYSLIGRQGALCGNVNLVNGRFHATEHAVVVDHNDEINTDFLFYVLNNLNLNRYATGQAQPGLSVSSIERITFSFPLLPEQQKIADFITAVDDRIQTQNKIIQHLESLIKGFSQKLFSQQLRFKDDNGNDFPEWEEKRLEDILLEINEKTTISNQYPILSSTAKGLFSQSDYFNRDIASKDNTGYKILRKHQLVLSPQNLWLGNINVNCDFEVGIVSPSYKVFEFNEKLSSFNFCKYLLFTNRMFYEYAQASEQGASVVRRNLDMSSFKAIKIKLPKKQEQTKIANFLSSLDAKLDKEKQLLEQYQQQKKFLLQNLFI